MRHTDTAKDIYRNATLDKVALLRLLLDKERKMHDSSDSIIRALQVRL